MKPFLIVVFTILAFNVNAQISDTTTFHFSDVIKVDSLDKAALYINARKFMVSEFKSAKDVIQLDDKETGIIVGKGLMMIPVAVMFASTEVPVRFKISIECRETRYKYEISDFIVGKELAGSEFPIQEKPKRLPSKLYVKICDNVILDTKIMVADLKKSMSDKGNNW